TVHEERPIHRDGPLHLGHELDALVHGEGALQLCGQAVVFGVGPSRQVVAPPAIRRRWNRAVDVVLIDLAAPAERQARASRSELEVVDLGDWYGVLKRVEAHPPQAVNIDGRLLLV